MGERRRREEEEEKKKERREEDGNRRKGRQRRTRNRKKKKRERQKKEKRVRRKEKECDGIKGQLKKDIRVARLSFFLLPSSFFLHTWSHRLCLLQCLMPCVVHSAGGDGTV